MRIRVRGSPRSTRWLARRQREPAGGQRSAGTWTITSYGKGADGSVGRQSAVGAVDEDQPQRLASGIDVLVPHALGDEHEGVRAESGVGAVLGDDFAAAAHDEIDLFRVRMVVQRTRFARFEDGQATGEEFARV